MRGTRHGGRQVHRRRSGWRTGAVTRQRVGTVGSAYAARLRTASQVPTNIVPHAVRLYLLLGAQGGKNAGETGLEFAARDKDDHYRREVAQHVAGPQARKGCQRPDRQWTEPVEEALAKIGGKAHAGMDCIKHGSLDRLPCRMNLRYSPRGPASAAELKGDVCAPPCLGDHILRTAAGCAASALMLLPVTPSDACEARAGPSTPAAGAAPSSVGQAAADLMAVRSVQPSSHPWPGRGDRPLEPASPACSLPARGFQEEARHLLAQSAFAPALFWALPSWESAWTQAADPALVQPFAPRGELVRTDQGEREGRGFRHGERVPVIVSPKALPQQKSP